MASRTTTTVIKTTQGSGGSRRRHPAKRKPARAKARVTAKRKSSSTSRHLTTTSVQRQAYKDDANKTNWLPLLGLLGLLGIGGYLLIKPALAGEGPGGTPGTPGTPGGNGGNGGGVIIPPNTPGGGGGTSPGGRVHPAPGTAATVNVTTGEPSLNLRQAPSPTAPPNGATLPNGTAITVVASNIPEQGKTAQNNERWWQVRTADGRTGFLRAVGPSAEWNVQFAGRVPATGFALGGYRPAAQPFAARAMYAPWGAR